MPVRLFLVSKNDQRHFFFCNNYDSNERLKEMLRQTWLLNQKLNLRAYHKDMFSSVCSFMTVDYAINPLDPKHEQRIEATLGSPGRLRC